MISSHFVDSPAAVQRQAAPPAVISDTDRSNGLQLGGVQAHKGQKNPPYPLLNRFSWGLSFLTGTIHIYVSHSSSDRYKGTAEDERHSQQQQTMNSQDQNEAILIQLKLPAWLSRRAFDSFIFRNQSGWTQHLKIYNVLPKWSEEYRLARSCIDNDDVMQMQCLLQNRSIHPWDSYAGCHSGKDEVYSLLEVSRPKAISHHIWMFLLTRF
jgi:hypothetical protein